MVGREIGRFYNRFLVITCVIMLLLVGLSGLLVLSPIPVLADTVSNDDFTSAEEISPDTHMGSLNATDLQDYYKISLAAGSIIEITFAADSTNTQDLDFYNPSKSIIFSLYSYGSSEDSDKYYLANETTEDYWYIKVSTFDGYGFYNFTVSTTKQNDAGTGDDVPATNVNAVEITAGIQISGHLEDLDVIDFYKIYLTSDSIVKITFAADSSMNQDLDFLSPSLSEIFYLYSYSSMQVSDKYFLANETVDGFYYIKISTFDGFDNYNFTVTVDFQDDAGSGGDVPLDYNNAYEIDANIQISGHLEDLDTDDMYKVNLISGSLVTILFSADSMMTQDLYFFNPSKSTVFYLTSSMSAEYSDNYTLSNETTTDYWFIKITTFDGFGNYNFTIFVESQNDAGSGKDIDQDYNNAYEVQSGIWLHGYLGGLDRKDMFKVLLGGGYRVSINFSFVSDGYMYLNFYDQTKSIQFALPLHSGEPEVNIGGNVIPDFWFVSVELAGSSTWGNYSFIVNVEKLDITPPKIFDISAESDSYLTTISWETDKNTNGTVYYGLDTSYGSVTYSYYTSTIHSIYLYGLEQGKTYHYKIVSYDELGYKNETPDQVFKVPRSSSEVSSQYNSLRTFIFGELSSGTRAYTAGMDVKITVYCYDKGKAITPESLNVSSATSGSDITMVQQSAGKFTGTYKLTQEDIDNQELNVFADVTYQGDNDTGVYSVYIEDEEAEDDWNIQMDYLTAADRDASFGDTINLKIIVTKNGVKTDPDQISMTVTDAIEYYARSSGASRVSVPPITPTKTGTGEYQASYTIPAGGNESKEYEFEVEITYPGDYDFNYFTHYIDVLGVWAHLLSLTNKSAEIDLYVTDMNDKIIPNADIKLRWSYYDSSWDEISDVVDGKTDVNGKANFKFNYPDIGKDESWIDFEGTVSANDKTQYLDEGISLPEEAEATSEPEPYGYELEVFPSGVTDYYSYYYATPDDQGNIKRQYIAYSDSELLINSEIYYYIVSGTTEHNSYSMELTDSIDLVKVGVTTTDQNGKFSIEVKHSSTRAEPDFVFYTIHFEAPVGDFEDFMYYGEVTSRDGKYYAEASNSFIVSDLTLYPKLGDLISGNIKITIPKLNLGTPTNIEVSYTGSFVQPQVMVNFYPGTFNVDTDLSEMAMPDWILWTHNEGAYLTKSNGKYTGTITIPSFITEETFTILIVVQNIQAMFENEMLFSYYDYIQINYVTLKIGGSVTDGGIPGPTDIPKTDTDGDGFTDAVELSLGTNPNDPTSYPGSSEDQDYEITKINNVEVSVVGRTAGDISVTSVSSSEAPMVPENVGRSFNFFIDISCDQPCEQITIVLELGPIGGSIIPAGTKANAVKLFYYDDEAQKWIIVEDSSYDPKNGLLTANLDHLTVFAPMAKSVGEKDEPGTSSFLIYIAVIVIVIIIVILVLLGLVVKKRKKGKGEDSEGLTKDARVEIGEPSEGGGEMELPATEQEVPPTPTPPTTAPAEPGSPTTPEAQAPMPPPTPGGEPQMEMAPEPPVTEMPMPGGEPQMDMFEPTTSPAPTQEPVQTYTPPPPPPSTPPPPPPSTPPSPPPSTPPPPPPSTPPLAPASPPGGEPQMQMAPGPIPTTPEPPLPPTPTPPLPPEQVQPQLPPPQIVPCPTCQKDIPVYTTPCPHCGINLNW